VTRLAVAMVARFPLSFLTVEDLPHERGIDGGHETASPAFGFRRRWPSMPRQYHRIVLPPTVN